MEEIARLNVFSDRLQARNESKNETSTIYRNKGLCLYVLKTFMFGLCKVLLKYSLEFRVKNLNKMKFLCYTF